MLLAALSTGHKLGLGLVGAAFIVFALASAFLVPTLRPDYPARRGLPAFLTLTVTLFVGMMFAVFFFGREAEETRAGGSTEPRPSSTATPAATTAPSTPARTTTRGTTTKKAKKKPAATPSAPKAQTVSVTEKDFKIELATSDFKAGDYRFELKNNGPSPHDLVFKGPGVDNKRTPVIDNGKTASVTVKLQRGAYELYCSVPGHKPAGMDLKINVS